MIATASFAMPPAAVPFEMNFRSFIIAFLVIAIGIWSIFVFTYAVRGQHWFQGVGAWTKKRAPNEFPNLLASIHDYWRRVQTQEHGDTDRPVDDEELREMEV